MEQIDFTTLLELFDEPQAMEIREKASSGRSTHVVLCEVLQMDSSQYGRRAALCVGGPRNTYQDPRDLEGRWYGEGVADRHYFTKFAEVPASLHVHG